MKEIDTEARDRYFKEISPAASCTSSSERKRQKLSCLASTSISTDARCRKSINLP